MAASANTERPSEAIENYAKAIYAGFRVEHGEEAG